MISELVRDIFTSIGHLWKMDDVYVEPTEDDVNKMLDRAAGALYDGEVGDRFESGGLIIEKNEHGFDVFVYVGPYL